MSFTKLIGYIAPLINEWGGNVVTEVLETASVYHYAQEFGEASGSFGESKNNARDLIFLNSANYGNGANDNGNAYAYLYNLGNSSKYSFLTTINVLEDNGTMKMSFGGGLLPQTSTVDGIRITTNTGVDLLDFNISLFGVKQLWVI